MKLDFKKVKSLTQRNKDLAFGYVRQAQYNDIIAYLVALYFHSNEYFEWYGPDIKMSDDKMVAECARFTKPDYHISSHTAYGHIRINNKVEWRKCVWTFQMNVIDDQIFGKSNKKSCIGLVLSNLKEKSILSWSGSFYLYYFCLDMSWLSTTKGEWGSDCIDSCRYSGYDESYDEVLHDGDIITLELDLETKLFTLFMHQKQFYEMAKIEMHGDIEYKLAVEVGEGRSIKIIDFQTY